MSKQYAIVFLSKLFLRQASSDICPESLKVMTQKPMSKKFRMSKAVTFRRSAMCRDN
jgi:hypothetical protein